MAKGQKREVKRKEAATSEDPNIAPDGGWGWFCVVGCAVMHVLLIGTERSYGLIYVDLREKFEESAAITAWVGSLGTALRMGLGPLAALLANRFSCRKVVMFGGCLFFLGIVLSSFAPSLPYLFVTWGAMTGIGGALVYTPGFIVVGRYFDKRRAVANGISTAGGGVGQFLLPPLYTALMHAYGFTGALLVTGAITLNLINTGALYRPLRKKTVKKRDLSGAENGNTDEVIPMTVYTDGADDKDIETPLDTEKEDSQSQKAVVEHNQDNDHEDDETTGAHIDTQVEGRSPEANSKSKKRRKKFQKYLDYTLLCDSTFLSFSIFIGFSTQAYVPTTTFLPALVISRGFTKDDATVLMSIVGVADMTGRICSGLLFDIKCIQRVRKYVYGLAPFFLGCFLMAFPFAQLFWHFILISIFYGLSVGTFLSQIASLLADWLGKERLSSAIGLATFFRGAGVMVGPVIGGLLRDVTQSYSTSFYYSAAAALCGCLTYMSLVGLHRIKQCRHG